MTGATTGTYLDRILDNTAREVEERKGRTPLTDLERSALTQTTPISMTNALRSTGVTVIAEVKRASPSKGEIAPGIDAAEVARDYIAGGASAISVLTDERFFRGSLDDLRVVAAVAHDPSRPTPVLRKDFIIDPYQITEARAAGADCILLIVASLDDERLKSLLQQAHNLGMDALVEVHDEQELDRALKAGATLVGVNSRDLRTFTVDLETIERLAVLVPPDITLVGESGIRTREDVERLGQAGVRAVLVGETLMRAPDRAVALRELLG